MGSGAKCNQTGCDNPAAFRFTWPGQDEAGVCLQHAQKLQEVATALGCPLQMIPLKEPADQSDPEAVRCFLDIRLMLNTDPKSPDERMYKIISRYLQKARNECAAFEAYKVEYESRAIWIEKMNKILGYDNSDGFHSTPDPFEIAATLTAKAEGFERLAAECDALKQSNDELRDQLCANTKLISELQHTVRLVQETHSQHIHECAVKAFQALEDAKWLDHDRRSATQHKDNIVRIICEAFGAPEKDEAEDVFERIWKHSASKRDCFKAFKAAWKLAKGETTPC